MTNDSLLQAPHSLPQMFLAGLSDLRRYPPAPAAIANLLELLFNLPPEPLRDPEVDAAVLWTLSTLRGQSQRHSSAMLRGRYALVDSREQGAVHLLRHALRRLPEPGALADLLEVLYHRHRYSLRGYGLETEVSMALQRLQSDQS